MKTAADSLFPEARTDRHGPLTPLEQEAILWHVKQHVQAALKAGIITEEQREKHGEAARRDLLEDRVLLAKMVTAYRRSKGGGNSMLVLMEHEQSLAPIARIADGRVLVREGDSAGMKLIRVGAAALSLAGPGRTMVAPLFYPPVPQGGLVQRDPFSDVPDLPPKEKGLEVETWGKRHERHRRRKRNSEIS